MALPAEKMSNHLKELIRSHAKDQSPKTLAFWRFQNSSSMESLLEEFAAASSQDDLLEQVKLSL
jgi:hypothetical protein